MKVIDLLNKIANGEEVPNMVLPKWFKVNMYLHYDKETNDYYNEGETYELFGNISIFLNDEVEIIEEDKKIEKFKDYIPIGLTRMGADFRKEDVFDSLLKIGDKINEIIDKLNKKGK